MEKQVKHAIIIYILAIVLIIIAAITRYTGNYDIMEYNWFSCEWFGKLFKEKENFSSWAFSHFMLYLILGYVAPDYWLLLFIIGVFWEIIEWGTSKFIQNTCEIDFIKNNYADLWKQKAPPKGNIGQYEDEWMSGKISDILFNFLGLIIGISIAKLTSKKSEKYPKQNYSVTYTT